MRPLVKFHRDFIDVKSPFCEPLTMLLRKDVMAGRPCRSSPYLVDDRQIANVIVARIMHQHAAGGDAVEVFALDGQVVDAVGAGECVLALDRNQTANAVELFAPGGRSSRAAGSRTSFYANRLRLTLSNLWFAGCAGGGSQLAFFVTIAGLWLIPLQPGYTIPILWQLARLHERGDVCSSIAADDFHR
ncbi:MAG: hypothetical protein KatS3mg111_3383 [Pirellulaceae bacterium]|nr:MAG: hypothetical protein KatS3mg111_3383 [Pirellulaceae bacterium]